jgi:hypothetical protein
MVEALMNDLFAAVPDQWVKPLAWLIMGVAYLAVAVSLIVLLVGQKAWDNARGQLVADGLKQLLRLLFWWPVLVVWVGALFVLYLRSP